MLSNKRLTTKNKNDDDGYMIEAKNLETHGVIKDKKGYIKYYGEHIDKLGKYEDLEEQGLLLQTPCKIGDTVYQINENEIKEFIVYSFDIRPLQSFICDSSNHRLNFNQFGRTVFSTEDEAKIKLEELKK